jgi:hypothetical protein
MAGPGLDALQPASRVGSLGPSHADGYWPIRVGCSTRSGASTAGSRPNTPVRSLRMGCSGCWPPPTGTRTWSAMTCAPTSWSTWATRAECWRWTDRVPQQGHDLGGRATAVFGHGWQGRQLPAGVFLAYASPQGAGVHRPGAGLLGLLRPGRNLPARLGPGSRDAMDGGGELPGQDRGRPGPLPGAPLARLVPAHHPGPAGHAFLTVTRTQAITSDGATGDAAA